jgi:hypothetical protein
MLPWAGYVWYYAYAVTRVFAQLSIAGSAIFWPVSAFVFDALNFDGMRGGVQRIFGSALFWVSAVQLLVQPVLCDTFPPRGNLQLSAAF